MKIKSFLFGISALLFSCVAFSQDSTKTTTTHHTTMNHSKKHRPMHKHTTTTHSMTKTKATGTTNASDSAK